jgi:hypothetical protein
MSSTLRCIGQAILLTSRLVLVVSLLAWFLLGSFLVFPSNSYGASSSMRPQSTSPKLQSEKMYSVQAPPPLSHIQITNPKNGSRTTNPYPILRVTADTHYNHVEIFVNNRTDYQTYAANEDGEGHWSLDMSGLLLPGRNNVTAIATFYLTLKPSLTGNSTILGPYIPSSNTGSWAYSKVHFDLVVPTPFISSPAEGAKIQIAGGTRPFITGTVDQHYVYVGLSVNMLATNTSVNRAVGEYYNDSIPQNGTGYWSVKLPGGESLRPGMQKITVWIPFVNLIGEPIVKIFGKPIVVAFICSDRIIVIHSHFCSQ